MAILLLGLSLAPGAALGARPTGADPVARGRSVAIEACASCHAVERGGVSPVARAPGFATTEMQHVAGLEGRVAGLTRAGHYGMPPVQLGPGQIEDLVAYIESLSDPDADRRKR
ncbi:cytochrome c [uncultured Phenylobacterium sp.]|uniref:c-type cytochrome n=1 Tax=uncultured Phenylobacterium sp. TaxID=349273 RepID=UPI0025E9BFA1|nr:cytochrome c [uncultured Phenylobacterium sp.]